MVKKRQFGKPLAGAMRFQQRKPRSAMLKTSNSSNAFPPSVEVCHDQTAAANASSASGNTTGMSSKRKPRASFLGGEHAMHQAGIEGVHFLSSLTG